MIFEKWREKLRHLRSTKNLASLELTNCIADWKTERKKLIGALEKIRQEKNCRLPVCNCDAIAAAVLAEVRGKE